MKIAQVAPLYESVPPKWYGGTERIVSYLTEELVNLGHDVTLFASGDSHTKAHLCSVVPEGLRLGNYADPFAYHILQLQKVLDQSENFDVIHFHTDYLHFPVSRLKAYTHLTTLHGRLTAPELSALYDTFADTPLVSISLNQRKPIAHANWIGNVYHGLPNSRYLKGDGKGGYLAFIGRICPEKGVDKAIAIAERAGFPLRIAAKVDAADRHYFETEIRPLLSKSHVEFIGEIGEKEKEKFLGDALALVFPINWPEPFGVVMIEALACGTPVVAFNHGSVPEVLDHGSSGFIVNTVEGAVEAIASIHSVSRDTCRQIFEERFSAKRMALDYVKVYHRMIHENMSYQIPKIDCRSQGLDSMLIA